MTVLGIILLLLASLSLAQDRDASGSDGAGDVIENSVGMRLALIPAGEFAMGSPSTERFRQPDERQHHVKISKSFYIGITEVTQDQWSSHHKIGDTPVLEVVNIASAHSHCFDLDEYLARTRTRDVTFL